MRPTTTAHAPDTITAALAIAYGASRVIVRDLLIPLLALAITLATLHREPTLPRLPKQLPPASEALVQPLEAHTVAQLRQMARAAGHKQLARSGRRQQLLEVLA
jgi:hypothetical protein